MYTTSLSELWLAFCHGIVRFIIWPKFSLKLIIICWKVPLGQATLKCLPALLAGNACILKPSPFTPYSALKLVEIAQQVLPPGLLQVLGGDEHLGPWLTTHPDINKISFTGSTATGKKVMQAAAGTLKRVTLELYVFSLLKFKGNSLIQSGAGMTRQLFVLMLTSKRLRLT